MVEAVALRRGASQARRAPVSVPPETSEKCAPAAAARRVTNARFARRARTRATMPAHQAREPRVVHVTQHDHRALEPRARGVEHGVGGCARARRKGRGRRLPEEPRRACA